MNESQVFLRTLFEDKPAESYILIWTLPDKASYWCKTPAKAAEVAQRVKKDCNVYVGVGLSPRIYGRQMLNNPEATDGRCKAADVAGIVGLWADIDLLGEGHAKQNLPPTIEDAKTLLADMMLEPSVIIHSGNGLQVWWLFKEPWVFDTPEERKEAMDLSRRWTGTLRYHAQQRGWDVDATQDLSRVLRVPGTFNRKGEEPKPVKILEANNNRYNACSFEEFLLDEVLAPQISARPASQTAAITSPANFALNPTAQPPFDKFEALREMEPKFAASFNRTRKDLQDQSASSYDLSLATYAVMVGWDDQEIVDLLIAARRKAGDELKLRPDYYARTLTKAKMTVENQFAQEKLDELAVSAEPATIVDIENKRAAILAGLSALFGVGIERIIKYMSDPPQYKLETAQGAIMLGSVEYLIDQTKLRHKIAAAAGRYIPRFKGDKWNGYAQALLDACEEETLGEESTDAGLARGWLLDYLNERRPILNDIQDALNDKLPFWYMGDVYIFGADLRRWLQVSQGERLSAKNMGAILRAGGCLPENINVQIDNKASTRGCWKLPIAFAAIERGRTVNV